MKKLIIVLIFAWGATFSFIFIADPLGEYFIRSGDLILQQERRTSLKIRLITLTNRMSKFTYQSGLREGKMKCYSIVTKCMNFMDSMADNKCWESK